ncbi:hypothetical protein AKJ09_08956 [Labilithrix luteola]|uniref:HTH luxR-type domain-containing protein n=1 Tax=Labilithrix luteola TaxID=1391654 RepID=A0A0K1Q984_9BACT|nr:helix-turn-helix transcriptional regulator [Labilithrix luteola]AKV02293.1 hypothetical protein AKJ09_08956 [Labilithrix luteola]
MPVERPLLCSRPDLITVVEAAYAEAKDDTAWAARLIDAIRPVFPHAVGAGIHLFEHAPNRAVTGIRYLAAEGSSQLNRSISPGTVRRIGHEAVIQYYFPRRLVTTHLEIDRVVDAKSRDVVREFRKSVGIVDALGMVGHAEAGLGFVFHFGFEERVTLARHVRERLSLVALHVESALRLRYRPESALAILSPDGVVHHLTPESASPEVLRRQVAQIEASRKGRARREPESLATWEALLDGRVSLVERTIAGKRYYLLLENAPARRGMRKLSKREVGVVRMAARGLPSKLVSYGLGLSPQAVSLSLSSAAGKLGLSSRTELVRLASTFAADPTAEFDLTTLTDVERATLALVRQGLSNREIAEARGRSTNTVANQIATILRKTKADSRRALIAARL